MENKLSDSERKEIRDATTLVRKNGIGNIYFSIPNTILIKHKIKPFDAQRISGYHPHGYGIYNISTKSEVTTWECSPSCD